MQTTQITREWTIQKKKIAIPTLSKKSFEYTGSVVAPVWESFSSDEITVGGTASASTPGDYTATFTPKANYCWEDGTTTTKSITWTIEGEIVSLPTQAGTLVYTGSTQSPVWNGYDSSKFTLGGTTSGTNAGEYTATFTPKPGCVWSDGSAGAKNVKWTINRASITATPTVTGSRTYSGSSQSPTWSNYDSSKLTIDGDTSGTNAGSYMASFTPKSNYQWSDGSTQAKFVTWSILPKQYAVPTQSGSITYNGSTKTPSWNNYVSSAMEISGTTSATNAGIYEAIFTIKDTQNTEFASAPIYKQSVYWTIDKAAGSLSISPTSLTFDGTGTANNKTITATTNNTGAVSASSSSTSIATTSVSGKTIIVTPKADGSTTITVGVAADTNFTAVTGKTCSVSVDSLPASDQVTASQFRSIIQAGKGPSAWAVGDRIKVPMSGSISTNKNTLIDLTGDQYASILGFNHNSSIEAYGNYADVEFFYNSSGTPICLINSYSEGIVMNATKTNVGGPKNSQVYTTTLPALLNLFDSSWKNIILSTTKYVDCTGNSSNVAANVVALISKLFLLAEFEVFGSRKYANQYEQNKQKQYDMYKNGTSKTKYSSKRITTPISWWLSSPCYSNNAGFCFVDQANQNMPMEIDADAINGLAPACRIG